MDEIKQHINKNYNDQTYKELFTLIPKRFMILLIKLTSIKILIPIPVAIWALNAELITQWVFFLIFISTFSMRSFEKIIEKNSFKF